MIRKKTNSTLPVPTEYQEACWLAEYLDILVTQGKIVAYSHIAQETFTKNWGTKIKNKKMGVHMGVPDYIIVLKKKVLFIELKRTKQSTTSPEQYAWQEALQNAGCVSEICYGANSAIQVVEDNL